MLWANFLHIYQPPDQKKYIMDSVVNESYRAVVSILKDNPHARITMSIIGTLLERLDCDAYRDVIDGLREVSSRGQIEFTTGTMFHPFLPKIPDSEIFRQINLNNDVQQYYFKSAYQPHGFYSPEAGYSYRIAEIAHSLGYAWTIVDEIAYSGFLSRRGYDFGHTTGFYSGGLKLRQIVGTVSGRGSEKDVPGTSAFPFPEREKFVDYSKLDR